MTSDVHVVAGELVANPYPLPVMEFRLSEGRYVPDAQAYMDSFPDVVHQHYAGADVRLAGNAVDYYRASSLALLGFLLLGLASSVGMRFHVTTRVAIK
jgi:hypothetical protein